MTTQGILVLDLMGIILLIWVLDLVRRGQLYVGYGVLFVVATLMTIVTLSFPGLLALVTRLVGAVFPASAFTLLALGFIILLLVYILTQLTIISNRLAQLVQELAIQRAREVGERRSGQVDIGTLEENE
jgi:hypothetical protein